MKDLEELREEIWVTEFTEESAQDFRRRLTQKAMFDKEGPLTVYIDSYGGSVDALAVMIEAMDSVSNSIITVCHGKAMSCGAMLLSHGDLRFIGKHSRVMVHEVSAGTMGNVQDMVTDTKEIERLNKKWMGWLAKNCGLNGYADLKQLIKDNDGRELYLDAEAAVKFGIVDAVGTPTVEVAPMFKLSLVPEKKPNPFTDPNAVPTPAKKKGAKKKAAKKTSKK